MAKDYAFDEAVELAKANLASCEDWVEAEDVIEFIQELHAFLQKPEAKVKKKDDKKDEKKKDEKKDKKDGDDD